MDEVTNRGRSLLTQEIFIKPYSCESVAWSRGACRQLSLVAQIRWLVLHLRKGKPAEYNYAAISDVQKVVSAFTVSVVRKGYVTLPHFPGKRKKVSFNAPKMELLA